jgi:iron complex outermembrane recepter protein
MTTRRCLAQTLRIAGYSTILAAAITANVAGAQAPARSFSIPAKSMAQALMEFGAQSDEVILAPTKLVGGKTAHEVRGTMEPERALDKLLEGSGLSWQRAADGSIAIVRASLRAAAPAPIRLAALAPVAAAPAESGGGVEEVVVTASKRGAESVQDIPISITAISQESMEQRGMDDFLDYARAVPGLGFQMLSAAGGRDDIRGGRRLNLRGIESGFDGVPTVAFYLDDAPVPVMDPKLFDIERIEVLRGPQGTLYGANSMGGAIRVVVNKPVQNELQYRADATAKSTQSGAESYDVNGMVNVPLVDDRLAARGVVFYRDQGGFIDNVHPQSDGSERVDEDTGKEESQGARLALSWQPSEDVRITPSVFYQQTKVNGSAMWDGAFRDLTIYDRKVEDRQKNEFTLTGLEASWTLGRAEVFSATSYFDSDFSAVEDVSKGFINVGEIEPDQVQLSLVQTNVRRLSEEIRVAYTAERWNTVLGVFYLDEQRHFDQTYPRADGSDEPRVFEGTQSNEERQLAVFSEGTYKLTDRLDVTAGVRWFKGDQQQHVRFYSAGELDAQDGEASESEISPKLQLSLHFDPDNMAYVSATKGFRPGGPTGVVPLSSCADDLAELGLSRAPTAFDSDRLWSYEIGSKLSFADRRAVINTSIYYIDWTDVQQTVLLDGCGFTFLGNVGAARSRGFEIEMAFQPTDHLNLTANVSTTDAEFTKSNPDVGIEAGDRPPLVPRWTAAGGAQYSFLLPTGHEAYVLADYQFQDAVLNGYATHYQKSYSTANARFGITLNDNTQVTLFVDNFTDARPQLFFFSHDDVGPLVPQQRLDIISGRPRTYGISFSYRH